MKLYLHNYGTLQNFANDTVKAMLVYGENVYSPGDRYVTDIAVWEMADVGYDRAEVLNKSRVVDTNTGRIIFSCSDISFGSLNTGIANGLIIYKEITSDLDSEILAYWPIEETIFEGQLFDIAIPAVGLIVISNA